MLKSLRIQGFRSCQDLQLDNLGDVTALIGRNAAGKSNILQGIQAVARVALSTGLESPGWREPPTVFISDSTHITRDDLFTASATIELDRVVYTYTVTATKIFTQQHASDIVFEEDLHYESSSGSAPIFSRRGETVGSPTAPVFSIGKSISTLTSLASLFPVEHPLQILTAPLRHFFANVRYFSIDEPAAVEGSYPFVNSNQYVGWKTKYNASGDLGDDVVLQLLYLFYEKKDHFLHLKDILGLRGLNIIDDIKVNSFRASQDTKLDPDFYLIRFCPKECLRRENSRRLYEETGEFAYYQLSQGTRRIIRLLTALAYDNSALILLEHPEDGVHKGLVKKVSSLLSSGFHYGQIIFSTHSDIVINTMQAQDIRFVWLDEEGTHARPLSPNEQAAAKEYINSDVDGTFAEFIHSIE